MDIVILHKMVKELNLGPGFTEGIENKSKEDQQALYDAVERRYNLKKQIMTKPSQQQQGEIDYLKHLASENIAIAREEAEKKGLYL